MASVSVIPRETARPAPWQRADTALVLAAALCALLLRLWGLASESVWLDEATSIWLAKMPLAEMVQWTAVDIHPPLYYAVLHGWLALGEGEAQTRLLSALCGAASVPALYLVTHRLFGRWAAVAAAALLATSPLHVWYSQQVRMYTMLTLLALLTSYCMLAALLDRRRGAWLGYVLLAICALYTHYYAFFVLLFQNVFALYLVWRRHVDIAGYRRWLAAQVIVAVAFLPWLPTLVAQVQGGGGAWVARTGAPDLGSLAATAINYSLGPDLRWFAPWLRRLAYAVFAVLCLAGLLSPLRRRRDTLGVVFASTYLVAPLAVAWIVSQAKPLYSVRYLLPFLPAYYILVGQGMALLLQMGGAGPKARRLAWTLALVVLLTIGCLGIIGSATHEQEADWRGVARYIVAVAQPGDIVVFVPGWNEKPFTYYAGGQVATQGNTPIPIEAADVPALLNTTIGGRTRLWLVQAEGHYADPTSILRTYLDTTYQRVDQRRFRDTIAVSLYNLAP